MKRRAPLLLPLLAGVSFLAHACAVPVFQYARESWPAGLYQVTVFHRGPLNAEQQKCLKVLQDNSDSSEKGWGNYSVSTVDLAQSASREAAALWEKQKGLALPALIAVYPDPRVEEPVAWSGPFDDATVRQLIDSPVRQELIREIKAGNAIVWLFIESGQPGQDRAALAALNKGFAQQAEYPDGAGANEDEGEGADESKDKGVAKPKTFKYAVVRVKPDAPAERIFVRMLCGLLAVNAKPDHAAAFPVFGRGRVLQALEKDALTADMVAAACNYLTGDCSCQVKEQNPGVDLLLDTRWDEMNTAGPASDKPEAPPLIGLTDLRAAAAAPAPPRTASALPAAAQSRQGERWWRGLLWAGAGAVALLLVATLSIWWRAQKNNGAAQ